MRHDRLLILGGFLMGAMIAVGCSGSSGTSGAGGGSSGAGGSGAGGKGAGGSTADAATDHGSTADTGTDTTGAGGSSADAHPDLATDTGTDTGSGDTAADMAVDMPADTGRDTSGPCVTNYGANNPVQYAFDGGANGDFKAFVAFDDSHTGFTTAIAASFTEGWTCPGALMLAANFNAYGSHEAAAIENYYGFTPNGKNWTGYKALHAWIKVETADLSALNGVYFYVKSGMQLYYQSAYLAGANLGTWQEIVIDLTRAPNPSTFVGVVANDIQLIGFQALLNTAPALGAPANPSPVYLLADDIWLEGAPPSDAGTDAGSATDAGGQ